SLIAVMGPILDDMRQALPPAGRHRFFYRIDDHHITKSPESILEKMARSWNWEKEEPPEIKCDNLREMKDLGRFRIVANFLSDVERISSKLEEPYRAVDPSVLSPAQRQLHEQFSLEKNRFKDLIALAPKDRTTGERCRKGLFFPRPPDQSIYPVEVQIVTTLQDAWDKKDHFLIYERRRVGRRVLPEHERISYALSEQLYLTDLQFDRLKSDGEPDEA